MTPVRAPRTQIPLHPKALLTPPLDYSVGRHELMVIEPRTKAHLLAGYGGFDWKDVAGAVRLDVSPPRYQLIDHDADYAVQELSRKEAELYCWFCHYQTAD